MMSFKSVYCERDCAAGISKIFIMYSEHEFSNMMISNNYANIWNISLFYPGYQFHWCWEYQPSSVQSPLI